jgi:hypothetical protein
VDHKEHKNREGRLSARSTAEQTATEVTENGFGPHPLTPAPHVEDLSARQPADLQGATAQRKSAGKPKSQWRQ